MPLDDRETLDLLNRGDTMGVFQLESGGMVDTCRRYGIQKIEDIIDLLALYRPGAMQFMDEMIEVKKGLRQVVYEHPLLEQVSGETYGVMIYQEQVQAAAKLLAGYTLGGADLLRRAMGKKDPGKNGQGKGPLRGRVLENQPDCGKDGYGPSLTRLRNSPGTALTNPTPPVTATFPTGRPTSRHTSRWNSSAA